MRAPARAEPPGRRDLLGMSWTGTSCKAGVPIALTRPSGARSCRSGGAIGATYPLRAGGTYLTATGVEEPLQGSKSFFTHSVGLASAERSPTPTREQHDRKFQRPNFPWI